jgi:hypothetical protein
MVQVSDQALYHPVESGHWYSTAAGAKQRGQAQGKSYIYKEVIGMF